LAIASYQDLVSFALGPLKELSAELRARSCDSDAPEFDDEDVDVVPVVAFVEPFEPEVPLVGVGYSTE
jgi:hypothetical protein